MSARHVRMPAVTGSSRLRKTAACWSAQAFLLNPFCFFGWWRLFLRIQSRIHLSGGGCSATLDPSGRHPEQKGSGQAPGSCFGHCHAGLSHLLAKLALICYDNLLVQAPGQTISAVASRLCPALQPAHSRELISILSKKGKNYGSVVN